MGRLLEAELQAHPYETMLKDEMIEKSAMEAYGPFTANDIEEREHTGNTEGEQVQWDGYTSSSESYGDWQARRDPEPNYYPERRQSRWRSPEQWEYIPRPREQPGVYSDRRERERERYEDERPPLARHRERRYERI